MSKEIDNETLMRIADSCVEQAQYLFLKDGYLTPVAIALGPDGVNPTVFSEEATKENQTETLRELVGAGSQAIVFITDAVVADSEDPAVTCIEECPESDRLDALLIMVYTRNNTYVRRLIYTINKENGRPVFLDKGWESDYKVDSKSVFVNPYVR